MKKIVKNSPFKFYCPKCDYGCCKKSHWNQHISTTKHKMITNDNKMITKKRHFCSCGKSYKFSSGLSRHLKVCPYSVEKSQKSTEAVSSENHALLLELKEMKEIMKKHGLGTVNNNNQTYNNKITVNVFLNEHCKNAMNLTDFIEKLRLEAAKIPQLGYEDTVSNFILQNLNDIPVIERPIHCSDKKRDKFYIKDKEDGWKIDPSNQNVNKVIDTASIKVMMKKIKDFEKENPDYMTNQSKLEEWQQLVKNTAYGTKTEEDKLKNTIRKKVGQNVGIKDAMSSIEIK
tara:strand:+ start:169 stop:1029 length:861 start_codon:yes stop_codon:yes gene_type:complete